MIGSGASDGGIPWRIVLILTLFNTLSYADRQLLALLAIPIQRTLDLSDVELGLLQGLAFSVIFTLSSAPVGWAVDHFNRAKIVFTGVTVWSIATMASGLAGSFWQLFFCRAGVGVGEASLAPSAYAILSETTPTGRLASAMGIYAIGASLGIAVSLAGGGLVVSALTERKLDLPVFGPIEAWQAAFLIVGAPGVVLAFAAFMLPGRPSRSPPPKPSSSQEAEGMFAYIRQHKLAYMSQQIGFSMLGLSGYAIAGWAPAHLERNFDWTVGTIGPVLGVAIGVSGLVGTLIVGAIADRAVRAGRNDSYYLISIATTAIGAPLIMGAFLVQSAWLCALLLGLGFMFLCSFGGISSAAMQRMTPDRYRGRVAALYVFTLNILGLGLGPLVVGAFTEYLFADRQMVGLSVSLTVAIATAISVALLLVGRGAFSRALAAAESTSKL